MIADSEDKSGSLEESAADKLVETAPVSPETAVAEGECLPQQRLALSIALHLIPGAVTTAIYIACVPAVTRAGYPPLAALLIGTVAGLIPIELGVLLFEGKRKNGRWSLDGIVLYREAWPASRYLKVVPVLVLICFIAIGIALPIDRVFGSTAFARLPSWSVFTGFKQYAGFDRTALLITVLGWLAFYGFLRPIVEEIYFRGYLLPRISRFGGRAVFLSCGLYAIYHFWQPYGLPTLFLTSLPIVTATWMTKNYRVGMAARVVLGLLAGLLGLIGVTHLPR
jgi:membrane protease YdiL (CAAX protease family)